MRPHESMTLDDLIDHLRRAGSTWFRNSDLLLLEELIRRVQEQERQIAKSA